MKRRSIPHIEVALTANADLRAAVRAALPNETGGILLGWRTASGLFVGQAAEVPDPDATTHRYERNFASAKEMLQAALANQPSDSLLGYVGEWHSHPAPVAASNADLRWIRHLARDLGGPIALVIASLTADTWRLSGTLAGRFRTQTTVIKDQT